MTPEDNLPSLLRGSKMEMDIIQKKDSRSTPPKDKRLNFSRERGERERANQFLIYKWRQLYRSPSFQTLVAYYKLDKS